MTQTRRDMLKLAASMAAVSAIGGAGRAEGNSEMYGLIGQMTATPGNRAELIAILERGTRDMPGNIAYVIAEDRADENALWITEIWDSQESHAASLELPGVQAAIAEGRPMIAGMGHRFETTPVAGV
ncbi:antibiotic biosynthesis monooxygenase [Parasphingopyxis algicola]|uniref:putative quinol monooxygenase n=1 Tax=Parasphingopyxis algicola TaxID=2026624 RepID=UPI0015A1CB77|nr:putative quinol monooxygenase [Parasphingopyxis algicola]QLC25139.1 antibiotic biosynthesis monooxygenase [Parasphingopyxis algicola]